MAEFQYPSPTAAENYVHERLTLKTAGTNHSESCEIIFKCSFVTTSNISHYDDFFIIVRSK